VGLLEHTQNGWCTKESEMCVYPKKQSNTDRVSFVNDQCWWIIVSNGFRSIYKPTQVTSSKDTPTAWSEIFCMITDFTTLCPIDTGPKSVTIWPPFEITTTSGCTTGHWASTYNVLCSLATHMNKTITGFYNKKLSYRRETARCVVSVAILPIATQQCRNYLYDKSWTNRSYEVGGLQWDNV